MIVYSVDYKWGRGKAGHRRRWFGSEKEAAEFIKSPMDIMGFAIKVRDVNGPTRHEIRGKDGTVEFLNDYADVA